MNQKNDNSPKCSKCPECVVGTDVHGGSEIVFRGTIYCKLGGFKPAQWISDPYNFSREDTVNRFLPTIPFTCPLPLNYSTATDISSVLDNIRHVIEEYETDKYIVDNMMYKINSIISHNKNRINEN